MGTLGGLAALDRLFGTQRRKDRYPLGQDLTCWDGTRYNWQAKHECDDGVTLLLNKYTGLWGFWVEEYHIDGLNYCPYCGLHLHELSDDIKIGGTDD